MTAVATPQAVDAKATSGGAFDPAAGFTVFVAGRSHAHAEESCPNVLVAVNELESAAQEFARLDRLCDTRKVMLDSGIFNLAMNHVRVHGTSHDAALRMAPEEIDGFDRLWDRYAHVVSRYADRLWGIVELDQGGAENKPRIRARIEAELGVVPMPVYHPLLDGWDYYDTLATGYDRICFGNLVRANPGVRQRLIFTASERARAYPHLWTHLLGVYPNQNVLAMPLRCTGRTTCPSWKRSTIGGMRSGCTHVDESHEPTSGLHYARNTTDHIAAAQISANNTRGMIAGLVTMASDTHPHLAA